MSSLACWLLALMSTGLLAGPELWGQEEANREAVALAEGAQSTKVSLIRGLSASARHGEPNWPGLAGCGLCDSGQLFGR